MCKGEGPVEQRWDVTRVPREGKRSVEASESAFRALATAVPLIPVRLSQAAFDPAAFSVAAFARG